MSKYKQRWEGLLSVIFAELVKIENLPEKTQEDIWVEGTLKAVVIKMCELHRLPPNKQQGYEFTRKLFE